jgi:hypothetical protein
LHAIGTGFSGMFSQLPAVFSGNVTQDPLQKGQGSAMRLGTGKAWGKTGMEMEKLLSPTANVASACPGSGEGGMLVLLHFLLLVDGPLWIGVLYFQSVTSGSRRS